MSFLLIITQIFHNWNMSQEIRKKLAENVKKYRLKNKLNREELSLMLGFDNSYISKLEKCKVNITIDKLSAIAKYFNINVKDLF